MTDEQLIHASYILLSTGLHVTPSIPEIPGIQHIMSPENHEGGPEPAVFHSVDYKTRDQLAGRRVLILGTGETGMDLTYEAVKAGAKEVVLCSRAGCVKFSLF